MGEWVGRLVDGVVGGRGGGWTGWGGDEWLKECAHLDI